MPSPHRLFKDLDLLADLPGEAFGDRTALYQRSLEPFCTLMDRQIEKGTILGTNDIFREYANVMRWPIRKLEYSFVLQHTLPLLEGRPHQRVLDAGCGVTPLPHLFAMMGAEVDAVDFDEDVINTLRMARVNEIYGFPVNHQWMDLRRLAFADSAFDIVTCVSMIERLGNGDEALALAEIVRVLKPGGKAILTTDVREGDSGPANYRDRRYDEPFQLRTLESLLGPYAGMLQGGLQQLGLLNGLQHEAIERFWISHWSQGSSWQGDRGYVALGIVLSKPELAESSGGSQDAASEGETAPDAEEVSIQSRLLESGDLLLKSQIKRTIELGRALERKEKVIRDLHAEAERRREKLEELDRAFRQAKAEWARTHEALSRELRALQSEHDAMLKSPVRYFRKVWQHLTSRRQGESG